MPKLVHEMRGEFNCQNINQEQLEKLEPTSANFADAVAQVVMREYREKAAMVGEDRMHLVENLLYANYRSGVERTPACHGSLEG